MRKLFIITIICLGITVSWGQQVEKSVYGDFLLTNGTIHTITNGVLQGAQVLIKDGMIAQVDLLTQVPSSGFLRLDRYR